MLLTNFGEAAAACDIVPEREGREGGVHEEYQDDEAHGEEEGRQAGGSEGEICGGTE